MAGGTALYDLYEIKINEYTTIKVVLVVNVSQLLVGASP